MLIKKMNFMTVQSLKSSFDDTCSTFHNYLNFPNYNRNKSNKYILLTKLNQPPPYNSIHIGIAVCTIYFAIYYS